MLIKDLLEQIVQEAQEEHEKKVNLLVLDKIQTLQKSYQELYKNEFAIIIDLIQKQMKQNQDKVVYNLSDACLEQLERLLNNNVLKQSQEKAKKLLEEREKLQKKIDEIDNTLSVNIEESVLSSLLEQIQEKESIIAKNYIAIEIYKKERSGLNGNLINAESELKKYIETILTSMEVQEDSKRTIQYANIAIEIIELFRIRLQEKKIDRLARTMTECYKKLSNKKNLINDIVIDSKTLNISYKNAQGDEIDKKRLSAGERQIMIVSLLWSLAICSQKKLPVIIDTPLSRLDSSRRNAFIKIYFPKASEQTIILSTDSEIDETYYKSMRKNIGDEFTLKFNDSTNTSKIISGYFGWDKNFSDEGENQD